MCLQTVSKPNVMNDHIYTAMGLMSGTSLDGVDVAIIETDGIDVFSFGEVRERPFTKSEKAILHSVTQAALSWGFDGPAPNVFTEGEALVDQAHLAAMGALEAEIVGYHGQTVLHHPPVNGKKGQTLQLGRGQVLADELDIPVAYDFRTVDVSAGGQGAPLAPIYHEALVRYSKLNGRVAIVNIGGVANVTFVDEGKLVGGTDCGPGNGPLDSWVFKHTGQSFDQGGKAARVGRVNHGLIAKWLQRDFFMRVKPRSADRYDFNVLGELSDVDFYDGAATLAAFTAQSIAQDLNVFAPETVVICGGGRKNPVIMDMLDMHVNATPVSAEYIGWNGDMLEAQAFAYLAVRTLKGLPITFPETTGAPKPMTGGRVVYPSKSGKSRGGE